MNPSDILRRIANLSRALDMVVYRLELPLSTDEHAWKGERETLRKELEQLRDQLEDLSLSSL